MLIYDAILCILDATDYYFNESNLILSIQMKEFEMFAEHCKSTSGAL